MKAKSFSYVHNFMWVLTYGVKDLTKLGMDS